jgi:hypothetical protein
VPPNSQRPAAENDPDWEAGISGYLYKQVTDDEQNDHTVGDGNRGQVVAFGPALRWGPSWKELRSHIEMAA